MKKLIITILLFISFTQVCFAKNSNKDYTLNFNGSKFHLLYSVKNKDFGGYLNEYYKTGETYNIWTELLAVHHFPNAYSPIDRIKDFKDYLGSMNIPSSLTFDDKNNKAMIDFIIITEHKMPVVMEFNIFKYEKSRKCGSIAVQYAKRYSATTNMEIEEIKKDFEKNRKKLIKKLKKFDIPEVITKDIDKCISATDVVEKDTITETANSENPEITTEGKLEEKIEQNSAEDTVVNNEIINEPISENITHIENSSNESQIEDNSISEETKTNNQIFEQNTENKVEYQIEPEITAEASPGNTDDKITEEIISESENIDNEKTDETINKPEITQAPVPEISIQTDNQANDNNIYNVANSKEDFYAKARTNKELKQEVKYKKNMQKESKLKAKKEDKLKKKAEKLENRPHKVRNKNSELIATPRSKKELKREIKERKKSLTDN